MSGDPSPAENHWRAQAARLAREVNIGWWWHRLSPALVGVNVAGALMLILFREMRWSLNTAAGFLIFAWLSAAVWAWARARAHFYAKNEGLLRLETHLQWHNVLSTAAAGGTNWPAPLTVPVSAVRWQWGPTSKPLAVSAVVLFLGWLVPVGSPPKAALPPPSQLPMPLQQVESWMETIKQQDVVEPATLDNWEDRLQQLREKPAQEWYGQNGLEAAEALRDELSQEMDSLGKNLEKASDMVGSLEALPSGANPGTLDASLAQTLSDLQNGGLPLQKSLAQALGSPLQLSKEQMQSLQAQLQKSANAMNGRQGQGQKLAHGDGQSKIPHYWGQQQQQPGGKGGGSTAPITYGYAADLKAAKQDAVSNTNLDNAALGEKVSEESGGPPTPEPTDDVSSAGGAANVGTGGEAVFRQELTPQERALLTRYFK